MIIGTNAENGCYNILVKRGAIDDDGAFSAFAKNEKTLIVSRHILKIPCLSRFRKAKKARTRKIIFFFCAPCCTAALRGTTA